MKKIFQLIIFLSFGALLNAQNIGINDNGATPNTNAILDVDVTTNDKGILIPRLTTAERTGIAGLGAGDEALTVYDTTTDSYWLWDGTQWVEFTMSGKAWSVTGNTGTVAGTNFLGTTDAVDLVFSTDGTERMRLDAAGPYLGIGTLLPSSGIDLHGISASTSSLDITRHSANSSSSYLSFYKTRGATTSTYAAVQAGDYLSYVSTYADDGSSWLGAHASFVYASAAPSGGFIESGYWLGLNDGVSGIVKRMSINGGGEFGFNNTTSISDVEYSMYPNSTTGKTDLVVMSYNSDAVSGSSIRIGYGRGTQAAHTPVLSGDLLGSIQFVGYSQNTSVSSPSVIQAFANENFSSTTTGSDLRFYTNPIASAGSIERLRLVDDGGIEIGGVMGGVLNADVHIVGGTSNATMLLAPNQTGSGMDATFYLAEDHDNTYNMNISYDGGLNQMQIEGYSSGTSYTDLITIERNTGNTVFAGTIAKGGGSFRIDHPLDPENKMLYHSFVESPDMMNIYNGNITTDNNGDAIVTLPDYFEALNMEFRYQLTIIGEFAQAIVKSEVSGNTFAIKTNKPNIKVSWQVTGVRKDAFANENRIPNSVDKKDWQKGYYIHPTAFGKAVDQGIGNAPSPNYSENSTAIESASPKERKVYEGKESKEKKKNLDSQLKKNFKEAQKENKKKKEQR